MRPKGVPLRSRRDTPARAPHPGPGKTRSRRLAACPGLGETSKQRGQIYVVDDDAGVRESTSLLLETACYEVVAFDSGEAFLAAASLHAEGCVLLDIRLPGMSGLEVQEMLIRRGSRLSVVMLSGYADVPTSVAAMRAGASDFIEKPYQPERLIATIEQALLSPPERRHMVARRINQSACRLVNALSPRQRQVLEGLVTGLSNKTIARDLALSPRTVEMHRADMMERLEVGSLSEALRIAYDAGLATERRTAPSSGRTGGRREADPRR